MSKLLLKELAIWRAKAAEAEGDATPGEAEEEGDAEAQVQEAGEEEAEAQVAEEEPADSEGGAVDNPVLEEERSATLPDRLVVGTAGHPLTQRPSGQPPGSRGARGSQGWPRGSVGAYLRRSDGSDHPRGSESESVGLLGVRRTRGRDHSPTPSLREEADSAPTPTGRDLSPDSPRPSGHPLDQVQPAGTAGSPDGPRRAAKSRKTASESDSGPGAAERGPQGGGPQGGPGPTPSERRRAAERRHAEVLTQLRRRTEDLILIERASWRRGVQEL